MINATVSSNTRILWIVLSLALSHRTANVLMVVAQAKLCCHISEQCDSFCKETCQTTKTPTTVNPHIGLSQLRRIVSWSYMYSSQYSRARPFPCVQARLEGVTSRFP